MDNFDEKILKVLRDDSRFAPAQIARMVGLDESEVAKRIKAMEASGVIAKYTALCNTEKLNEDVVTALIEVKVTPQMSSGFDTIAKTVYQFDEVKAVYLMSGAYDLCITVEGKNLREVSRFVSEKLSTMRDIVSTATHFILKKYKTEGVILDDGDGEEKRQVIL
ncbi:MAG: Lrp/AsnC family transcriptional regulator [Clostridia bacterium]|nr:Lrp/AsnC family transcriptional regulator [Clostridia bacterium]MDE6758690.1 Lrp/AsnC family transcriptional regulator [Clostridia bacterium]MDE7079190.1 Lrp/AsnC family transcriptional regulator [Clostridia bacterium]